MSKHSRTVLVVAPNAALPEKVEEVQLILILQKLAQ